MIQMDIRWTAVQLNLQSWNVENLVVLDCDQLIRWGDGLFLVGGDKEQLLKQVCLVRRAEDKLLEMTSDLDVRAEQAANYVSFQDYYERN